MSNGGLGGGWKGMRQSLFDCRFFFSARFPHKVFKLNEAHGYLALKLHLKAEL